MSVTLLDVNVLIALTWPHHIFHSAANAWFDVYASRGWASCPMTEAGFIRLSSNPRVVLDAVSPAEAAHSLRLLKEVGSHQFWPDDLELTSEYIPLELAMGHQQITDAYLLGLAIKRKGQLVTLDRSLANLLPADSPYLTAVEIIETA